jgi:hypothetical protein
MADTGAAPTKEVLDKAFTDAIGQINALITATKVLKDAYSEKSTATPGELKGFKDEKKRLSDLVQAKLAEINRMLGVPPATVAAAPAAAAKPEGAAEPDAAAEAAADAEAILGGGRKPAKKTAGKPKRAQKGGSDAAIAPSDAVPTSVYNIQGLMTQTHNPYLVASDANIAAMSRIHAPFSAGVVGDVNQQTTAELSTALVGRMTPQPPMAGGAKRKSAKTGAAKKK